tara:strand:+ start:148 stop:348 length:201 start_codon:yes stop_codon:yes gene_type:complete
VCTTTDESWIGGANGGGGDGDGGDEGGDEGGGGKGSVYHRVDPWYVNDSGSAGDCSTKAPIEPSER